MTINEILTKKYIDLTKYCQKNIIQQVENTSGIKDIEDLDLLNTLCLRWLKKYKTTEFETLEIGYNQIKTEFLAEKNHYQKMTKPDQKRFVSISDLNIDLPDDSIE